jgi:hypothetical protein
LQERLIQAVAVVAVAVVVLPKEIWCRSGGSGIVIIRYSNSFADAVATTGSPAFANTGGFKIYTWTGSGSITF